MDLTLTKSLAYNGSDTYLNPDTAIETQAVMKPIYPPTTSLCVGYNNASPTRRGAILMGAVEFNHNLSKFYCPKMEREKRQNSGITNNIGICPSCWQGGPIFDLCQILLHSEMTSERSFTTMPPGHLRELTVIIFLSNGWSLYFIII